MKYISRYWWLIFIFQLSSCLFPANPRFSNAQKGRYRFDQNQPPNTNILEVSFNFGLLEQPPKTEQKPIYFSDLRDSLPHVLMKELSKKTDDGARYIELLKEPLSKVVDVKAATSDRTDYLEYKVKLDFSHVKVYRLSKDFVHPNTRIEFLNTKVSLHDDNNEVYFKYIDRLKNEFETIDMGTLERTGEVTFQSAISAEGNLGASSSSTRSSNNERAGLHENNNTENVYDQEGNLIGSVTTKNSGNSARTSGTEQISKMEAGIGAKAELSYLNKESIKEGLTLQFKKLRTGFSINEQAFTISQLGLPMNDVSDNVYVTLTIGFRDKFVSATVLKFTNLYNGLTPAKANELRFTHRDIKFVPPPKDAKTAKDIKLKLSFEGVLRAVRNEWSNPGSNILEFDDRVTYYPFKNESAQTLTINRALFTERVYGIQTTSTTDTSKIYHLYVDLPVRKEVHLRPEEGLELFLAWLNEQIADPKAENLKTDKFRMYFENMHDKTDKIYIVNNQIGQSELLKIKQIGNIQTKEKTD